MAKISEYKFVWIDDKELVSWVQSSHPDFHTDDIDNWGEYENRLIKEVETVYPNAIVEVIDECRVSERMRSMGFSESEVRQVPKRFYERFAEIIEERMENN